MTKSLNKPDGWHSRRHRTREAQDQARANFEVRREHTPAREPVGPQEQLDILDARLGKGKGAVKERARLQARLDGNGEPGTKKRTRRSKKKTADESLLDDIFEAR